MLETIKQKLLQGKMISNRQAEWLLNELEGVKAMVREQHTINEKVRKERDIVVYFIVQVGAGFFTDDGATRRWNEIKEQLRIEEVDDLSRISEE